MPIKNLLRIPTVLLLFAAGAVLPASASTSPAATRCLTECSPRVGIVSAFGAEADILLEQTRGKRIWSINGNRFTTGTLRGNRVVIVLSGVGLVNATMTTQAMLDHFRIDRLILSGIAGGVNPANHVGDVLVPERWAMPTEIYWNGDAKLPAACGKDGEVECLGVKLARDAAGNPLRAYVPGDKAAGQFMRENQVITARTGPQGEFRFDFPVDPQMLAVARDLHPALEQCGPHEPRQCVSEQPVLRVGGRGVSGNAFLANPAYRQYLHETIAAESMDMETAALAQVAYANGVPFIAFRSVSDLAGGNDFKEVGAFFGSGLAETNEARVTLDFLAAWQHASAQARKH